MEGISEKTEHILAIGLVGVGLYVVYQLVQGVKAVGSGVASAAGAAGKAVVGAAQDVAQPISSAIADTIVAAWKTWDWATGANMVPSGNVVMPDGTVIPLGQLGVVSYNNQYNLAQFSYGGLAYVIPQNPNGPSYDTNGNYHAVSWNTYVASLGS